MRRDTALGVTALLAAAAVLRRRRRAAAPQPVGSAAPSSPAPAASATAPPSTVAQPTASPGADATRPRFQSVAWTLVEAPAARPELTVAYERGEQVELDRVDVRETPTQVFVTVLVRATEPAAASVAPPPARAQATVSLSRPLGERELIHAPVDPGELAPDPL